MSSRSKKKTRTNDSDEQVHSQHSKSHKTSSKHHKSSKHSSSGTRDSLPDYTSKDLKGMKIGHSLDNFTEGKMTILTLKDKDILDEETEETLINVNMLDEEKLHMSNQNKKSGTNTYDPFDDTEFNSYNDTSITAECTEDSILFGVKSSVLDKYDGEISGKKESSFYLSDYGSVNLNNLSEEKLKMRNHVLKNLGRVLVSLDTPQPTVASDYFTEEEMSKFKKPKKRQKVVSLRADDLLEDELGQEAAHQEKSTLTTTNLPQDANFRSMQLRKKYDDDDLIGTVTTSVQPGFKPFGEDDMVTRGLARIKNLRQTALLSDMPIQAYISSNLNVKEEPPSSPDPSSDRIVFDSTSEFCRSIQNNEASTLDQPDSDSDIDMALDSTENNPMVKSEANDSDDKNTEVYLEAEPIVSHSISSALLMADRKGFLAKPKRELIMEKLELDNEKERGRNKYRAAEGERDRDKNRDRDRDWDRGRDRDRDRESERGRDRDYRDRDRDRGDRDIRDRDGRNRGRDWDRDRDRDRGRSDKDRDDGRSNFPEIKNYNPEISLPYVDDYGMELTQKEAFRILSHRFHGKGPGKMKMERRQKKAAEELSLQKMNSVDTPLNTGAMMRRKMENSETAFLVLSGGQTALQPVIMSKTNK